MNHRKFQCAVEARGRNLHGCTVQYTARCSARSLLKTTVPPERVATLNNSSLCWLVAQIDKSTGEQRRFDAKEENIGDSVVADRRSKWWHTTTTKVTTIMPDPNGYGRYIESFVVIINVID